MKLSIDYKKLGADEEYEALVQAQTALVQAHQKFVRAAKQTEKYKLAAGLMRDPDKTSVWDMAHAVLVFHLANSSGFGSSTGFNYVYEPRPEPPKFVDPKTLNTLLNGKLLSDQQKLNLLKQQGIMLED